MKKLITIFVLLFSFTSTTFALSDAQEYNSYLLLDCQNQTYINYYINDSVSLMVKVPSTRSEFIELEKEGVARTHKYYQAIKLNKYLKAHGLEPLYY